MFQSVKHINKANATESGHKTMVCIVVLKVKRKVALKTVILWIIKDKKKIWERSIGKSSQLRIFLSLLFSSIYFCVLECNSITSFYCKKENFIARVWTEQAWIFQLISTVLLKNSFKLTLLFLCFLRSPQKPIKR